MNGNFQHLVVGVDSDAHIASDGSRRREQHLVHAGIRSGAEIAGESNHATRRFGALQWDQGRNGMRCSLSQVVTGVARPPPETTRRTFLLATAAVTSGFGVFSGPTGAQAQQPAPAALDDVGFLRLSKAVTGHADLDPTIASRLLAALHRADPGFIDHAAHLARLVHDGQPPEALLAAADAAGLRDTMLTLVAAWYTGTVGHGQQAEMVSYADALMYRPVSDGLPVPTYCFNGGIWWTGPPPAAGVSAPAGTPLASPAPSPAAATPKGG